MLSVKKELSICEDARHPLSEDQMAAADLVAANARSPDSGPLLSSNGGQRVIQVIQCSNNSVNAVSSNAPRYGQLRPLQSMQLGTSLANSSILTNSAFQYAGAVTSLGGPQMMKNSAVMDFGNSKMINQSGQLLSSNVGGGVAMSSPTLYGGVHNSGTHFGMSMGQAGIQLNSNPAVGVSVAVSANSVMGSHPSSVSAGTQARKPCNCTKSHCLKLYCDCFAQGQLCQNCNCTNCMNNLQFEEERARVIKMTLDRNPMAFHPKIGRGEGERKHTKGCNCKKSGCLKNYCECYEAKISCTELCRCQGCKNTDDGMERRSLMRLSMMSQTMKSRQQVNSRKSFIGPVQETEKVMEGGDGSWSNSVFWESGNVNDTYNRRTSSPSVYGTFFPEAKTPLLPPASCLTGSFNASADGGMPMPPGAQTINYPQENMEPKRAVSEEHIGACCSYASYLEGGAEMISPEDALPHNFITWEVAEACCGCMLAQADDAERRDMLPAAQERIILEEFGRCLGQIVESACKTLPLPSYPPGGTLGLSNGQHCSATSNAGLVMHPGSLMSMAEIGAGPNDDNVIVDV